jgi:hypothetical protein
MHCRVCGGAFTFLDIGNLGFVRAMVVVLQSRLRLSINGRKAFELPEHKNNPGGHTISTMRGNSMTTTRSGTSREPMKVAIFRPASVGTTGRSGTVHC